MSPRVGLQRDERAAVTAVTEAPPTPAKGTIMSPNPPRTSPQTTEPATIPAVQTSAEPDAAPLKETVS